MKLPSLIPDAVRTARVQALCHAQLARQRQRFERGDSVAVRIERVVVCGLCAVYMAAVVFDALQPFLMG